MAGAQLSASTRRQMAAPGTNDFWARAVHAHLVAMCAGTRLIPSNACDVDDLAFQFGLPAALGSLLPTMSEKEGADLARRILSSAIDRCIELNWVRRISVGLFLETRQLGLDGKFVRRSKRQSDNELLGFWFEEVMELWAQQEMLRAEAFPMAHRLDPTPDRLLLVCRRLHDGYSVAECEKVLNEVAKAARRGQATPAQFNGHKNWTPKTFREIVGHNGRERSSAASQTDGNN